MRDAFFNGNTVQPCVVFLCHFYSNLKSFYCAVRAVIGVNVLDFFPDSILFTKSPPYKGGGGEVIIILPIPLHTSPWKGEDYSFFVSG
jgi:hypothetical protein